MKTTITKNQTRGGKLIVNLVNPPRDSSSKGTKTFRTTYSYPDVPNREEASRILTRFAESRKDGSVSMWKVKKACYNGRDIVYNGQIVNEL